MKSICFSIVLSSISFLYGMEQAFLISQKKERYVHDTNPKVCKIRRCADIMNIPTRDIACSIRALEPFRQYQINRMLASSFTFNIAMLPKDICLYIFKRAYDDNDDGLVENRISFFCEPILHINTLNKELRDNPIKICNKEIALYEYLALTKQERDRLRSAINPSRVSRFIEGKSETVFSHEDYETIIQFLPSERDRSQLVVLPSWYDRIKMGLCGTYEITDNSQRGLFLASLTWAQSSFMMGKILDHSIATPIFYTMGVIIDGIILSAGTIYAISNCRDHIVAQARDNGAV